MSRTLLMLCGVLVLVGCPTSCDDDNSPTGASQYEGEPPSTVADDLPEGITPDAKPWEASVPQWSPYLGIHPWAWGQNIQEPYLLPLLQDQPGSTRGPAVRGVRLDVYDSASYLASVWALENGAEDVLAIFPNELIGLPNAWELLEAQMTSASHVKYWEIGNEVNLFIDMSPEEYTPKFLELYDRACAAFPNQEVIPMPIMGGVDVDMFLKKMLDMGVLARAKLPEGDPCRLNVLSVHAYGFDGPALGRMQKQIQRLPAHVEVFVTETSQEDQSTHIGIVQDRYPRMRSMLRATRIYWYNFAGCDTFMLISGFPETCGGGDSDLQFSPLYNALIGGVR